jgi:hypothetical protein
MNTSPYEVVKPIGQELLDTLDTPHAFLVLCDLNGSDYYTSTVKANVDHMSAFALSLIETMLDNGANDDEILEAYTQIRQYIAKRGGSLRPARQEDFDGEVEEDV